jgi:CheY-like chemotaxis protein
MSNQPPFEILVVEDNAVDVTLVREALIEHGLNCVLHVVHDGRQAIDFLETLDTDTKQPQLDLILLDMHLPRCDGEDILKALRSTEHYAQTPVVVMTASNSPRDQEMAQKHAALHYFQKPSTLDEFLRLGGIVREILTKVMQRIPSTQNRAGGS